MTTTNSVEGWSAFGAYDNANTPPNDNTRHCIVEGWPHGTSLAVQWFNGTKRLVPGIGIYPSGIWAQLIFGGGTPVQVPPLTDQLYGMESVRYPSWGLNPPTPP